VKDRREDGVGATKGRDPEYLAVDGGEYIPRGMIGTKKSCVRWDK